MKAVRANGVPAWFLVAEDEGHGFKKKSNRSFQLYATVLFVEQHLLDIANRVPNRPVRPPGWPMPLPICTLCCPETRPHDAF